VTWRDDWPMIGVEGKGVITHRKPDVGGEYPARTLPTSDEFDGPALGMQWGWNHNPDTAKWSLTRNPGFLRLSTVRAVPGLREARNTLTQRIFAYYSESFVTTATVKMDVRNMREGDVAGLAVFQDPYAYIGVRRRGGGLEVVMVNNGRTVDSAGVRPPVVYLRAMAHYGSSSATFAHSPDNRSFTALGNRLDMRFNLSVFTGNKFCLFNYATEAAGGFVDFDWFRVDTPARPRAVPAGNPLPNSARGVSSGAAAPEPLPPGRGDTSRSPVRRENAPESP
jgi:beta-xylosidase